MVKEPQQGMRSKPASIRQIIFGRKLLNWDAVDLNSILVNGNLVIFPGLNQW